MWPDDGFAGEQLRLARLAHGLSLDELGQQVAVSRQYLHQLEVGTKPPTQEMKAALADALGVTTRFFAPSTRAAVHAEQCHFRKQATTPVSVTSQVLARGTLLDRFIARLDAALELPPVDFPQIAVSSAEDIEAAAEACRRHWGLGLTGPITNMTRVVENAGAVVICFSGISDRVDALSMDRPRPLIIRSEAKPAACRLRFDIAHECAHLVMHRGIQTGDRETEGQAHRFASAFLLPRGVFAREFPQGRYLNWAAIFNLKLRWKVSARAIIRRAYDLGLITADRYRSGNIHLNRNGQAKVELHDDVIEPETPEVLTSAFAALTSDRRDALRELAVSVDLGDAMFERLLGQRLPAVTLTSYPENVVPLFRSTSSSNRDAGGNL
ncbi:XRE family transcriptional regulator [Sphingomonas sp. IC-56]|nr:XRE family transcriptional regulator [Sphingomonas sp. IC-56]